MTQTAEYQIDRSTTIAELEAMHPQEGTIVYLDLGGRSGTLRGTTASIATEVTADTQQGIYIAAFDDATGASGGWIRQGTKGILFGEYFGIDENSTAAENATPIAAAIAAQDYGLLRLGAGSFSGEWVLNPSNADGVSLVGNGANTVLMAGTDGQFAVAFKDVVGSVWRGIPVLRDLRISGNEQLSSGLAVTRKQAILGQNLEFQKCVLGIFSGDNYYHGYRDVYLNECDVGYVQGNFPTTQQTITDMFDAVGPVTVTLPEAPGTGHSGNKSLEDFNVRSCRIGAVFQSGGNTTTLRRWACEGNDLGALFLDGEYILEGCWFESNGDGTTTGAATGSTTTVDFNGVTYPVGGITVRNRGTVDTGLAQTLLTIRGGRTETLEVGANCRVLLDDDVLVNATPTVDSGGSIIGDRIIAEHRALEFLCYRPSVQLNKDGRYVTSYCVPKTNRVYNKQPQGGRVLIADDMTGVTYGSANYRLWNLNSSLVWEAAGGLFDDQKCVQAEFKATAGSPTSRLEINPATAEIVADTDTYVLYIAVKLPEAGCRFQWSGASSTHIYQGAGTIISVSPPVDEWVTICYTGPSRNAAVNPYAVIDGMSAAGVTEWGGIQFVRFTSRSDAAEYIASSDFYMTEV